MEKSDIYRSRIMKDIGLAFRRWQDLGDPTAPSPEQLEGNEWMWALYPPTLLKVAYHVPDLVVVRDRNPDGSPNSIAIEVEIKAKPSKAYEKTLRAYKDDRLMFGKVIWVCRTQGPANELTRIAKEIGLWQEGRFNVVPILTDEGVFRGDLWTI